MNRLAVRDKNRVDVITPQVFSAVVVSRPRAEVIHIPLPHQEKPLTTPSRLDLRLVREAGETIADLALNIAMSGLVLAGVVFVIVLLVFLAVAFITHVP